MNSRAPPGRTPRKRVRYREGVIKWNGKALRAGAIAAGTTLATTVASPAFALTRDDGDDPGPGLSVAETLGLYVAIPLAVFLLIAGAVMVFSKKDTRDT